MGARSRSGRPLPGQIEEDRRRFRAPASVASFTLDASFTASPVAQLEGLLEARGGSEASTTRRTTTPRTRPHDPCPDPKDTRHRKTRLPEEPGPGGLVDEARRAVRDGRAERLAPLVAEAAHGAAARAEDGEVAVLRQEQGQVFEVRGRARVAVRVRVGEERQQRRERSRSARRRRRRRRAARPRPSRRPRSRRRRRRAARRPSPRTCSRPSAASTSRSWTRPTRPRRPRRAAARRPCPRATPWPRPSRPGARP